MSRVEIEVRAPRAVDATPARWRGDAGHSPLDCHTGSDVLEIDPSSVKALFRQGKCYLALDKWDAAKESFRKVLELDDGNMEARRGLQSVRVKMQAQKEKEKKLAAVLKSNCRGASTPSTRRQLDGVTHLLIAHRLYAGKKLFDGKDRPAPKKAPPASSCCDASAPDGSCCPPPPPETAAPPPAEQ